MAGQQGAQAIERARTKLGARYVLATAGPETFDCSGFTWWVAQPILGPLDYELRSSHHQYNVWGEPVPDGNELLPGDLLFFDTMGVVVFGNRASHVALYLGSDQMIHAANEDLGVRADIWRSDWYWPRFIGARRIFDLQQELSRAPHSSSQNGKSGHEAPRLRISLELPAGEISTPNQWNGGRFPVDWAAASPWLQEVAAAARESHVDARVIATVAMMETQFTHYRDDQVLSVWDHFPEDGPAVGMCQWKPQVWGWLTGDLDPYLPGSNLRGAGKIIAHLLEQTGGDLDAAMRKWFPAKDPNGSNPNTYMRTFWGLLKELGYAS